MERITPSINHADTTARNADLQSVAALLQERSARRHDIVVPATALMSWKGDLHVKGSEPVLTADGVTTVDGVYTPTNICDEGLSEKFSIPRAYLRRLREDRTDLLDMTLNHHLRGGVDSAHITTEPDSRSFLLRTLRNEAGSGPGIARAILSDKYAIQDDLDILMAVLSAVRETGLNVEVDRADLTERKMHLRLTAPEITALAPVLTEGYRSPYRGEHENSPVVSVGLRVSNSEVGAGAFTIQPEVRVLACNNGLVVNASAIRSVHLGAKMDAGQVNWSADTMEKNAALVAAKTRDAVSSFLSEDWLRSTVAKMEAKAGVEVATVDAVRDVTKSCKFTDEQMDLILGDFVRGGQMSVAGVVNAITSASQRVADADTALEMDMAAGALLGV